MTTRKRVTTVLFDIGDVLFTWSARTSTSIPPKVIKQLTTSPPWMEYERARIDRATCYEQCGELFGLSPADIAQAFDDARASLQPNTEMMQFVRTLSQGPVSVFAMSNIGREDYEVLRQKPGADWSLFDRVFTSAEAGMRKPDLGFYQWVMNATGLIPEQTVFIDDKLENVLSARSLGMHGIVFDDAQSVIRQITNLVGDPARRGRDFLERNAGTLRSITGEGLEIRENFAQLLILELMGDSRLVDIPMRPAKWNFFDGPPEFTTQTFPEDVDTTSIALTTLPYPADVVSSVMDEMLGLLTEDGIIQTYFDSGRPRFDPVVCANVLSLFHTRGRGAQLQRTLSWVSQVLLHRAYLDGTRYYASPECFLFFFARFLQRASLPLPYLAELRALLAERLRERVGAPGDALALAMRVVACATVGVRDEGDLGALLALQEADGGWGWGCMYKYGASGLKIGNRGLTTAMAVRAIEEVDTLSEGERRKEDRERTRQMAQMEPQRRSWSSGMLRRVGCSALMIGVGVSLWNVRRI